MATQAHCAYAFECLVASFEKRQPLGLGQVEELWEQYHASSGQDAQDEDDGNEQEEDEELTDAEATASATARPAAISRLLGKDSATSSSSSLPSTKSTASSTPSTGSGASTPATSRSSLSSSGRNGRNQREEHPLFITWNTVSRNGHKSLRGCIGTFQAQELEKGMRSYALTR